MPDSPSPRTQVKRRPQRAHYQKECIYAILDEATICHVGFLADGYVTVLPTSYWRIADRLYIHGSPGNRMLGALANGAEACITVSLLDGLVLARSAFNHSMNYRSVVLFAKAQVVESVPEKFAAFEHFFEHLSRGRWSEIRQPSEKELQATLVLAFEIIEASAKIRIGPAVDDPEDYALPVWAGVVPLQLTMGRPVPDAHLPTHIPIPHYILGKEAQPES